MITTSLHLERERERTKINTKITESIAEEIICLRRGIGIVGKCKK